MAASSARETRHGGDTAPLEPTARPYFRVLGAIDVLSGSRSIDLGGKRQRRLAGALVAQAGRVIRTDSLVEQVWDATDRPDGAAGAIRTYVSRIRRALHRDGFDAAFIVVTEPRAGCRNP